MRNRIASAKVPALLICAAAVACNSATSPEQSVEDPGDVVENESSSQSFLVDPHRDGEAQDLRVVEIAYGRLVDVYGQDEDGVSLLMQPDFLIGEGLESDPGRYMLERSPLGESERLVIQRDVTDTNVGGGRDQFFNLLRQVEQGLTSIANRGPDEAGVFTMVPRNAAIMLRFDDLLDASSLSENSVRVLVGLDGELERFDARVIADVNHGGSADIDEDGTPEFYSTRVIVDPVVSASESFETNPPRSINSVGFPASFDVSFANLHLRLPTRTSALDGVSRVLQNPTGHTLALTGNGSIDFDAGTRDVQLAMRSGGRDQVTGDPFNGFLRDMTPPRIVGNWGATITGQPVQVNAPPFGDGTEFVIPTLRFDSLSCARGQAAGDLILQGGIAAEILSEGSEPTDGIQRDVRVRLLEYPATWASPAVWLTQAVGPIEYRAAFDPLRDAARGACFVDVFPPTSEQNVPTANISTASTFTIHFSEPMDPAAIGAFDALALTRKGLPADEDALLAPVDFVVATVLTETSRSSFTLVPDELLAHDGPGAEGGAKSEIYFLQVAVTGAAYDLAGNPLTTGMADIPCSIGLEFPTTNTGGRVSRFARADEEAPFADPAMDDFDPKPEWTGQHVYSTERGTIRPRPVTRFSGVADRNQTMVGAMPALNPFGVQEPLNSLGARLQTVYRYVDFGFGLLDEANFNIDVEGINWAPVNGQLVAEHFDEFEIRLSHSQFMPDEAVVAPGVPAWPLSGLVQDYAANILDGDNDPVQTVHPRTKGYTVNPADVFVTDEGTTLMPYPLNREGGEKRYYTWRDTSLQRRAAPNGFGVDPLSYYFVNNLDIPAVGSQERNVFSANQVPSIGLPLLMEFRCFNAEGSQGLNRFDISMPAILVGNVRPHFRAFSAGGINAGGDTVVVNPDTSSQAEGGFNPAAGGAVTPGVDNTFYIGSLDLVTRVSRSYSIWFAATDPKSDGLFAGPKYGQPVMEPRPEEQPLGTHIELAFRGADVGSTGEALTNARTLDGYGDHYQNEPGAAFPNYDSDVANQELVLPNGSLWIPFEPGSTPGPRGVLGIDNMRYYQTRVTFIANPASGLVPELSSLGVSWTD